MIIYKITNTINDKIYIGQTTVTLEARWGGHKAKALSGTTTHLYNAMRKYGIEKFKIEEICRVNSLQELNKMEEYFIKEYDSISSGYNILKGGDHNPMTDPETKRKHLAIVQSQDFRMRVSESLKRYHKVNKVSQDTRNKLSTSKRLAYLDGRMPKSKFPDGAIQKASIANQKATKINVNGELREFESVKKSCEWLQYNHFKGKHTLRNLQKMATKSNRKKEPIDGVLWSY